MADESIDLKRISALSTEATRSDWLANTFFAVDNASIGTKKLAASILVTILNNFAKEFKSDVACMAGKCYWKDGVLYKCKNAHSGTWSDNDFEEATIDDIKQTVAHLLGETATDADFTATNFIAMSSTSGQKKIPLNLIAKASGQTALTTYAQNVAHSIAQEFDPNRTSENPYKAGESVMHEGKNCTFKVDHYGPWDNADVVSFADVMYMLSVDSSGVVPLHQRLNGELGSAWVLYNGATSQNIDDYVSVTTANVGFSGIRNSYLPTYLSVNKIHIGEKFHVCFYARLHTGSSATIKLYLGGSPTPQNRNILLTDSWKFYDFEVDYSSGVEDILWLQFSTTELAQEVVFDVRSVVVFASDSLLGRLYKIENDTTYSQAISVLSLNFAGEFLTTKDYFKYQIVTNGNKLYQFKSNHSAGDWSSSDVREFSFEKYLEGVIRYDSRLNGNLSSSWYAFNDSTLSIVDDYVKVVTSPQSFSGIRNDSWRSWFSTYGAAVGEKFLLSFWARNEVDAEKTLSMYVGYSSSLQNKQFVIDGKWRLYTFEIEYVVDDVNFNRLQVGNAVSTTSVTFDIKDVELYPMDSIYSLVKLHTTILDNNLHALSLNFAGNFSTTKDYFKYQIVINENKLYQFKASHSAGAWSSSDVREFSFEKYLEGVVKLGLRLNGNLPASWYGFNGGAISAVDDYVRVVTTTQNYSGIRNDSFYSWLSNYGAYIGEKYLLSFWARNESVGEKTLKMYVGDNSGTQNKNFTVDSTWKLFVFELTVEANSFGFGRLQIGNSNVSPSAFTFNIKDVEIYPIDSPYAKSKILEAQLQEMVIPVVNPHPLADKKIAVIGDSISTIYQGNTPYWTIKSVDVGNEVSAYVSWFDVYSSATDTTQVTNKTIGGVTLTAAMIGTLQTFIPVAADIGKDIGVAYNNNGSGLKTWEQVLCEKTGAELIANASFSGSSMCDGQSGYLTNTHGFSPYTIGRCRVRDDAGNFVNPDVIFVYRGTNDMTHGQGGQGYSVLDEYDMMANGYPITDVNSNGKYSFRRAYYMTIKALRDTYPKAMIYCCTLNVFKRIIYDRYPTRNGLYSLPMMNKVIREIATEMGCGLVDFERDGITFENCYSEGYITDSATTPTHPNSKGHAVMGKRAIADTVFTN